MNEYKMTMEAIVAGPKILAEQLKNIDHMDDEQIYTIIKSSYSVFLSSSINDTCLQFLRTNTRFLNILSQVLMEVTLTADQQIYCNAMIYQELSKTENEYLKRVYYILAFTINHSIIDKLLQLGIKKGLAIYLATISKSSFSNATNILRLNFSIVCANSNSMTIQMITNIYCTLFNTVDEIKELFFTIMKDTTVFTSTEEWITEDMIQVAYNINYAILSILETLPLNKLTNIFIEYSNMATIEDLKDDELRFSFKSVNLDLFPITKKLVSDMLEQQFVLP